MVLGFNHITKYTNCYVKSQGTSPAPVTWFAKTWIFEFLEPILSSVLRMFILVPPNVL